MNFENLTAKIGPATKAAGVFGCPVKHSASPAMQNAAFRATGLDYVYLPFEIKPENIGPALNAVKVLGFKGVNLTIPHKETSIPFLDEISDEALKIKAVNTVLIDSGKLKGFNTDIEGFLKPLIIENKWRPEGKKAVVLGAGGAARAVVFALLREGAGEIVIANRNIVRADELADFMRNIFPGSRIKTVEMPGGSLRENICGSSLVVNCTPLGLKGETPLEDDSCLGRGITVYDLIYKPSDTPLLTAARKRGAGTIGGLGMLVYQGAASFRIWTSVDPPVDVMKNACEKAVGGGK